MVTLNLTDIQAIILHAVFTNHLPEEIVNIINQNYDYYIEEDPHSPYTAAYESIKKFIKTNPENKPFSEDDIDLFDELEWAVEDIGRDLLKAARRAKLAKETNK